MQTWLDGQVRAAWAPVAVADVLVRELVFALTGTDPGPVHHACPRCGSIEHGRPYVEAAVEISVAHAPGLSLVAASRCGPVGIDVERGEEAEWVRTEAVAKAHGTGIVVEHTSESAWIAGVDVPDGFVAAVAVLSPVRTAAPAGRTSTTTHRTTDEAVDH